MNNAELAVKTLQEKVTNILQTTDWDTKGMPPDVITKMVEIKGSFRRLDKKLAGARIIFNANNG